MNGIETGPQANAMRRQMISSEARWPIVIVLLLLVMAAVAWSKKHVDYFVPILPLLSLGWASLLFAWFVHCFTGEAYDKRTKAIVFTYFFMILAFGVVAVMVLDIGKASKFGFIEGCVENFDQSSRNPIQCDYPVVSIQEWLAAKGKKPHALPGEPIPLDPETNAKLREIYETNANYHYLINIGGHLTDILSDTDDDGEPRKISAVRGGLPVPLYFILFALMGGSISLAKNIPGIQKRSDDGWVATAAEPKLLAGDARELLIFQVLQFISAPIIAVVAYHSIKPESLASTVALGFLAGFASDSILAQMRNVLKGGQTPAATQVSPAPTGSIHGTVVDAAASPVSGATVELLGTSIRTLTGTDGSFDLTAIPVSSTPYSLRVSLGEKGETLSVDVTTPTRADVPTVRI